MIGIWDLRLLINIYIDFYSWFICVVRTTTLIPPTSAPYISYLVRNSTHRIPWVFSISFYHSYWHPAACVYVFLVISLHTHTGWHAPPPNASPPPLTKIYPNINFQFIQHKKPWEAMNRKGWWRESRTRPGRAAASGTIGLFGCWQWFNVCRSCEAWQLACDNCGLVFRAIGIRRKNVRLVERWIG